jgi:hypothetical protein
VTSLAAATPSVNVDESLLASLEAMGFDRPRARLALSVVHNQFEQVFDVIDSLAAEEIEAFERQELQTHQVSQQFAGPARKIRHVPLELQRLFCELLLLNQATVSTKGQ